MNERIDQLLVKAGAYFGGEGVDYSNFDPKKFAELIVGECMACSTWVGKVNKNTIEPIHTAHAINQRIKKHFGVNSNEITTAMLDTTINQIEEYKKYVAQQQKENLPHISYGSWELYNKPKKEQE